MSQVLLTPRINTNHEIDGRPATQDVGAWNNGLAATEPLGWSGLIEGSCLAVQLHVAREDARAEDPWVVQVVLSALNQQDGEIVVKIGQSEKDKMSKHSPIGA